MADVVKVEHDDGSVSIGVEVDGVYVPLGSATKAKIDGLKERSENLAARYESDPEDKAVAEALSSLPTSASSTTTSKSKSTTKPNGEGA